MDIVKDRRRIVLTGAGFSANWGGLLAGQVGPMMATLLADAKAQPIRSALFRTPNYEDVWADLEAADPLQARLLVDALCKTFEYQEEVMNSQFTSWNGKALAKLLLRVIDFASPASVLFVTTNQDCFLEGLSNKASGQGPGLSIPGGMPGGAITTTGENWQTNYVQTAKFIAPTTTPGHSDRAAPYLKLHGSLNWKTPEGQRILISGKEKDRQIGQYPALTYYWNCFAESLDKEDIDLICIGFSFGDEHIRAEIEKHCRDSWRIFIISLEHSSAFISRLDAPGAKIPGQIRGYWPTTLRDMYPIVNGTAPRTVVSQTLERALFNLW
ncbi:MAG: SIR2 family protein [Armatimonadetes bacterium]|nr:SIR2 family protein [Armatimonadota bacterium]